MSGSNLAFKSFTFNDILFKLHSYHVDGWSTILDLLKPTKITQIPMCHSPISHVHFNLGNCAQFTSTQQKSTSSVQKSHHFCCFTHHFSSLTPQLTYPDTVEPKMTPWRPHVAEAQGRHRNIQTQRHLMEPWFQGRQFEALDHGTCENRQFLVERSGFHAWKTKHQKLAI